MSIPQNRLFNWLAEKASVYQTDEQARGVGRGDENLQLAGARFAFTDEEHLPDLGLQARSRSPPLRVEVQVWVYHVAGNGVIQKDADQRPGRFLLAADGAEGFNVCPNRRVAIGWIALFGRASEVVNLAAHLESEPGKGSVFTIFLADYQNGLNLSPELKLNLGCPDGQALAC
ncbi:MAG: hypothetical protein ACOY16_09645 [Chloroflexota bacterium]